MKKVAGNEGQTNTTTTLLDARNRIDVVRERVWLAMMAVSGFDIDSYHDRGALIAHLHGVFKELAGINVELEQLGAGGEVQQ